MTSVVRSNGLVEFNGALYVPLETAMRREMECVRLARREALRDVHAGLVSRAVDCNVGDPVGAVWILEASRIVAGMMEETHDESTD